MSGQRRRIIMSSIWEKYKKHPSYFGITVGLIILAFIIFTIITKQHAPPP